MSQAPDDAVVETEEFASARAIFDALSLSNSRWPEPTRWCFRGHGDIGWELIPSMLRDSGDGPVWHRYASEGERETLGKGIDGLFRAIAEANALKEFIDLADRAGLAIPDDTQAMRGAQSELISEAIRDESFPTEEFLSQLALAQHYGIPTRLLDWTWRPRVAAYFAAADAIKCGSQHLEIVGLNTGAMTAGWSIGATIAEGPNRALPAVSVVTAPQASNPNLQAQSGLFTVARKWHEGIPFDDVLKERFREMAAKPKPDWLLGSFRPALKKLSLASSEAVELLRLLHLEGVHAGTVYPGYKGIVDALAERKHWRSPTTNRAEAEQGAPSRLPDTIAEHIQPLLGQPAWGVRRGHGSFLTFEFGKPSVRVADPTSRRRRAGELGAQRRVVSIHGEWHLWVYCCGWFVYQDERLVGHSESGDKEIADAVEVLNGQILSSVKLREGSASTVFDFDLGARLVTEPYGDDSSEEQWLLYKPDGDVLTIRADAFLSVTGADSGEGTEQEIAWSSVWGGEAER